MSGKVLSESLGVWKYLNAMIQDWDTEILICSFQIVSLPG